MYNVNINNSTHRVDLDEEGIYVDGELLSWDLIKVKDNLFHLIHDSNSYMIEIVTSDTTKKQSRLKVNGVFFDIAVQDKYDILLEKLGMQPTGKDEHREVRAPMPGMILDVLVKEGQEVSKGENLVILEAMKMENIIKSSGEGTIETINIHKGMNVEKNQVLIQF
jgi:biotin carboxyl carrier protein